MTADPGAGGNNDAGEPADRRGGSSNLVASPSSLAPRLSFDIFPPVEQGDLSLQRWAIQRRMGAAAAGRALVLLGILIALALPFFLMIVLAAPIAPLPLIVGCLVVGLSLLIVGAKLIEGDFDSLIYRTVPTQLVLVGPKSTGDRPISAPPSIGNDEPSTLLLRRGHNPAHRVIEMRVEITSDLTGLIKANPPAPSLGGGGKLSFVEVIDELSVVVPPPPHDDETPYRDAQTRTGPGVLRASPTGRFDEVELKLQPIRNYQKRHRERRLPEPARLKVIVSTKRQSADGSTVEDQATFPLPSPRADEPDPPRTPLDPSVMDAHPLRGVFPVAKPSRRRE